MTDSITATTTTSRPAIVNDLLSEAKSTLDLVITHLSGDAPAVLTTVSADALVLIEDLIPTPWRGTLMSILKGVLAGTEQKLVAGAESYIVAGLGVAKARLDALL